MTETSYHGWDIPTEGASVDEWAGILNQFFEGALDASVALRGPLADRPADAPDNAVFHATDRDEFYRFDSGLGGWVSASAHVDEARRSHDDVQGATAAYQQVGDGSLGSELRHTQQIVGTRHMACHWPFADPHFRDDNFRYSNSGTSERIQLINYSFLEQPPNMVPVLRAQFNARCTTTGETFEAGIKHQFSGDWLMQFEVDTTTRILYDEVYLHDVDFGSAAPGGNVLTGTQLEVHAGIGSSPSAGGINGGSQLMLDWEVV